MPSKRLTERVRLPVKLKYAASKVTGTGTLRRRILRGAIVLGLAGLALFAIVFGYYYHTYQKVVDDRLRTGHLFSTVSQIYAAPREIRNGQKYTAAAVAAELRRAGYGADSKLGTYELRGTSIFIKPGPESYHSTDGATIDTAGGVVQKITAENGESFSRLSMRAPHRMKFSTSSQKLMFLLNGAIQ